MPEFDLYKLAKTNLSVVVHSDRGTVDLRHYLTGGSIQDNIETPSQFASLQFLLPPEVDQWVRAGDGAYLVWGGSEWMRGRIWRRTVDRAEAGIVLLDIYDDGMYLQQSEDDRVYYGATATTIVRDICTDFNIAMGSIAETGVALPTQVYRGKSLWEMIVEALVATRRLSGRKYLVRFSRGRLNLVEVSEPEAVWVLAAGSNLTRASRTDDMTGVRTRIKVLGSLTGGSAEPDEPWVWEPDDPAPPPDWEVPDPEEDEGGSSGPVPTPVAAVLTDEGAVQKFGLLQRLYEWDHNNETLDQARAYAADLLRQLSKVKQTASVGALGRYDVRAGDPVIVREPVTGLGGQYWVRNVEHIIEGDVVVANFDLEFEQVVSGGAT